MKVRQDPPAHPGYNGKQGGERFRTILKYPVATDMAMKRYADATPSLAQAIKMKKFSQEGKLSNEVVESIMSEEKPNQKEKIRIKYEDARRFIPDSVPYNKTGEYIMKALEYYHRVQERQKDRGEAR